MGVDLQASMRAGISSSSIVVVLASPDYAKSENCMFELKTARDSGKPIITCVVEPGFWKSWTLPDGSRAVPDDHELVTLAGLKTNLFVNLEEASRVNWQSEPVSFDDRRRLTHNPLALPRLLKHVKEAQLKLALREGGGSNAAAPISALPVPAAVEPAEITNTRRAAVALATSSAACAVSGSASGGASSLAPVARDGALQKTMSWRG
jgi:hypothetical protein